MIDLDIDEISDLAVIQSMLESICDGRSGDCRICPLSRSEERYNDCISIEISDILHKHWKRTDGTKQTELSQVLYE